MLSKGVEEHARQESAVPAFDDPSTLPLPTTGDTVDDFCGLGTSEAEESPVVAEEATPLAAEEAPRSDAVEECAEAAHYTAAEEYPAAAVAECGHCPSEEAAAAAAFEEAALPQEGESSSEKDAADTAPEASQPTGVEETPGEGIGPEEVQNTPEECSPLSAAAEASEDATECDNSSPNTVSETILSPETTTEEESPETSPHVDTGSREDGEGAAVSGTTADEEEYTATQPKAAVEGTEGNAGETVTEAEAVAKAPAIDRNDPLLRQEVEEVPVRTNTRRAKELGLHKKLKKKKKSKSKATAVVADVDSTAAPPPHALEDASAVDDAVMEERYVQEEETAVEESHSTEVPVTAPDAADEALETPTSERLGVDVNDPELRKQVESVVVRVHRRKSKDSGSGKKKVKSKAAEGGGEEGEKKRKRKDSVEGREARVSRRASRKLSSGDRLKKMAKAAKKKDGQDADVIAEEGPLEEQVQPERPATPAEKTKRNFFRRGSFLGSSNSSSSDSKVTPSLAQNIATPVSAKLSTCVSAVANVDFSQLSAREKILNEIVNTENDYVNDLGVIIEVFLKPIREYGGVSAAEVQQVFSNIEVIYDINKEFNHDLRNRVKEKGGVDIIVGDLFNNLTAYFKLYTMYCINQETANKKFRDLMENNTQFRSVVERQKASEQCRKMSLTDFMIKPMQRLCKYPLLLKELLKKTDSSHPDFAALESAMAEVGGVVKYINERKRVGENQQKIVDIQHSIDGCPSILAASRKFTRDATITIVENKQHNKRQLYLFSDMILIARPSKKGRLGAEDVKTSFDRLVHLKDLKIVDHADTDDVKNAFELCHKVDPNLFQFMVSAEDAESKRSWIKDIKGIVKSYQRSEYLANKDRLVKEQEEREAYRLKLEELTQTEVNPTPSQNSDSWTLGIILWHLYTGRPLFEGLTFEQAAVALMTRTFEPKLDGDMPLPQEFSELLQDCWLDNADSRPSYSMAYDRIRMLDCQRPENPLAVAMAFEQAKQYHAKAAATMAAGSASPISSKSPSKSASRGASPFTGKRK